LIIFSYAIFAAVPNNGWRYALFTLFVVVTVVSTFIPLRFLAKGLFPVSFLILFTLLVHWTLTTEGPVVFELGTFSSHWGGIQMGLVIALRFLLLILMTSLLTLTTTPIEITDAIESLLRPLRKVKFPVHELALMMSISL